MLAVLNRMSSASSLPYLPTPLLPCAPCATRTLTDYAPFSTIARSFSAELEGIFRIEDSVADLDAKLDERCVTQSTS